MGTGQRCLEDVDTYHSAWLELITKAKNRDHFLKLKSALAADSRDLTLVDEKHESHGKATNMQLYTRVNCKVLSLVLLSERNLLLFVVVLAFTNFRNLQGQFGCQCFGSMQEASDKGKDLPEI